MPKKDNRLIIYEKLTQLLVYSKNLTNKFPKSERFDLSADIKQSIYVCIRKVIFAWKEHNIDKRKIFLDDVDVELYVLKSLTRMSYEFKYISPHNYMVWNEKISEIGKMLGGWIKVCQKE